MHNLQTNRRHHIFCGERAGACEGAASDVAQLVLFFVGLTVVYVSMFFADGLSECAPTFRVGFQRTVGAARVPPLRHDAKRCGRPQSPRLSGAGTCKTPRRRLTTSSWCALSG